MTRLHHLALGTRDVEQLARFYRDALELLELERHFYPDGTLRSIWLALADSVLMIEHSEESPRQVAGVGAGFFLLAFAVAPNERTRLEAKLEALGSAIESRSEWTSYSRDPDGNRIALSAYPLAPSG
ncbi:MAG TPA: VOC family protein [Polyangiaceae bacterium]|nr:VOC family protein [Polyangiaceae bacterium]